jgi:hypothetical protein
MIKIYVFKVFRLVFKLENQVAEYVTTSYLLTG